MTGDGPGSAEPARDRPRTRTSLCRVPCPRMPGGSRTPWLLVLACAPAEEPGGDPGSPPPTVAPEVVDRLDGADLVFTTAGAETTVLFYAEAWRVERLDGDARPLAGWLTAHPGATTVLVTSDDLADGVLVDAVAALVPGLRVERSDGPALVPPRRHPLGWGTE